MSQQPLPGSEPSMNEELLNTLTAILSEVEEIRQCIGGITDALYVKQRDGEFSIADILKMINTTLAEMITTKERGG